MVIYVFSSIYFTTFLLINSIAIFFILFVLTVIGITSISLWSPESYPWSHSIIKLSNVGWPIKPLIPTISVVFSILKFPSIWVTIFKDLYSLPFRQIIQKIALIEMLFRILKDTMACFKLIFPLSIIILIIFLIIFGPSTFSFSILPWTLINVAIWIYHCPCPMFFIFFELSLVAISKLIAFKTFSDSTKLAWFFLLEISYINSSIIVP